MTKATGVGRGGKRHGSGRPRKLGAVVHDVVARAPEPEAKAIRKAARDGGSKAAEKLGEDLGWGSDEVRVVLGKGGAPRSSATDEPFEATPLKNDEPDPEDASSLVGLALATIRQIMRAGPQDGPRIAAAKEVFRRAEVEAAAKGLGGKKQALQNAAEKHVGAGGRFAVPAPPGSTKPMMQ